MVAHQGWLNAAGVAECGRQKMSYFLACIFFVSCPEKSLLSDTVQSLHAYPCSCITKNPRPMMSSVGATRMSHVVSGGEAGVPYICLCICIGVLRMGHTSCISICICINMCTTHYAGWSNLSILFSGNHIIQVSTRSVNCSHRKRLWSAMN